MIALALIFSIVFQFHKGTIKTPSSTIARLSLQFQFHKGTIKTGSTAFPSFNIAISIP